MKIKLTVLFSSLFFLLNAQNIIDNKVRFQYVQLPKIKIDEAVDTYFITYKNSFVNGNDRQNVLHQLRVDSAERAQELQIQNWELEFNQAKKQYLTLLSVWKENENKGVISPKPQEPIWPVCPEPYELFPPVLTRPFSELNIQNNFQLSGFEEGNSGIEISIDNLGLEITSTKGTYVQNTQTPGKTYKVISKYKMPVHVVVNVNGNKIYEKMLNDKINNFQLFTGKTEYDYQLWKIKNREENKDIWEQTQANIWKQALNSIESMLNEEIGYPEKSEMTEVYVVKKYQDYTYNKLIDALTLAQTAYSSLAMERDKSTAKTNLEKAIALWEEELQESDLNEKKARINKKITGLINANLADAYFWSENFEKANYYINQTMTFGTLKAKSHCKKLKKDIAEFQKRYTAYSGN